MRAAGTLARAFGDERGNTFAGKIAGIEDGVIAVLYRHQAAGSLQARKEGKIVICLGAQQDDGV